MNHDHRDRRDHRPFEHRIVQPTPPPTAASQLRGVASSSSSSSSNEATNDLTLSRPNTATRGIIKRAEERRKRRVQVGASQVLSPLGSAWASEVEEAAFPAPVTTALLQTQLGSAWARNPRPEEVPVSAPAAATTALLHTRLLEDTEEGVVAASPHEAATVSAASPPRVSTAMRDVSDRNLSAVSLRAEERKQRQMLRLDKRLNKLFSSICELRRSGGERSNNSSGSRKAVISFSDLVTLVLNGTSSLFEVMTVTDAEKSIVQLFEQGGFDSSTTLEVEDFKTLFWKETEAFGEPSALETVAWLETLCTNALNSSTGTPGQAQFNKAPHERAALSSSTSSNSDDIDDAIVRERMTTTLSPQKNASIAPPHSNDGKSNDSSSDGARKLRRSEYLRSAVDPVFVPLLNAVVHHEPQDVELFCLERMMKDLYRNRRVDLTALALNVMRTD